MKQDVQPMLSISGERTFFMSPVSVCKVLFSCSADFLPFLSLYHGSMQKPLNFKKETLLSLWISRDLTHGVISSSCTQT